MVRTFFCMGACWLGFVLPLVPVSSRSMTAPLAERSFYVRVYLNPNTGRFWTMDSYEGDQEDALSLHKYLYGEDSPVDGTDPSGHAVYFVERHFEGFVKKWAFPLDYGHGYLLFTSTSDPGTGDPFETHQTILDTFSWHPYLWDFDTHAEPGVPGRLWENDTRDDWTPGFLHDAFPVTVDPGAEASLLRFINTWKEESGCGYEYGNPIPDPNDPKGNEIGDPHKAAPPGGVFYSLYGQNCVWWATATLKDSGINVPSSVYNAIRSYNHGIGYAQYVISGARSANTFGTLSGIPFGISLTVSGYDLSDFDTGL